MWRSERILKYSWVHLGIFIYVHEYACIPIHEANQLPYPEVIKPNIYISIQNFTNQNSLYHILSFKIYLKQILRHGKSSFLEETFLTTTFQMSCFPAQF